jgi:ubiquinone/menaquinone biosynthesis C-methylase UbiE
MIGWNEVAKTWNNEIGIEGNWFQKSIVYPTIADILVDVFKYKILDIGCGNGHLCRHLKNGGANVVGVDSSENMISECQMYSDDIEYAVMNAECLAFKKNEFDCCIFNNSIQDIEKYEQALIEAYRILNNLGKLIVITRHPCFHPADDNLGWYIKTENANFMNGKGLTNLLYEKRNFHGIHFVMDNYFDESVHMRNWYGKDTYSFRRTLQEYYKAITESGFFICSIIEPKPIDNYKSEQPGIYNLLNRIPNFIIFVGEKTE